MEVNKKKSMGSIKEILLSDPAMQVVQEGAIFGALIGATASQQQHKINLYQ